MNPDKCECHLCTQSRRSQFEKSFDLINQHDNTSGYGARQAAIHKMVECIKFYANELPNLEITRRMDRGEMAKATLEAWKKANEV